MYVIEEHNVTIINFQRHLSPQSYTETQTVIQQTANKTNKIIFSEIKVTYFRITLLHTFLIKLVKCKNINGISGNGKLREREWNMKIIKFN